MFIKYQFENRPGAIAILTLLGVTIFGLLVMNSLATAATRESQMGLDDVNTTKTFYAAESGLNVKLYEMATGNTISMPSVLGITPTVSITPVGFQNRVQSEARDGTDKVRRVEVSLVTSSGGFASALQAGSGGIIFTNGSSTVNGSVYSNGNIKNMSGGSSTITGDVTLAGGSTIIGPINVIGHTTLNAPLTSLPITSENIVKWKTDIMSYGNTPLGNTTFNSSATLGWQKIDGNLTVNGNGTILTLTGNIWVTGNVIIKNKAKIIVSNSLGSNSLLLLADDPNGINGKINVENNTELKGSGDPSSFLMLVSTNSADAPCPNGAHDAVPAIQAANNSDTAIFSAPFGVFDIKAGNINAAASQLICVENSTTVNYNPAVSSIFIPSPNTELTVASSSWMER